ncbi:MAG: hypothetical protein P8L85_23725 [Rubripirellula sp.]|nr:hypothetical protein [Rubripirellula sp.]
MSRLLLVLVTILGTSLCQNTDARGPFGRFFFGSRVTTPAPARTHSEPTIFGMGVGVGSYPPYNYPRPGQFDPYRFDSYVHDPYRSGSFEAPDLLNDPYFRERHRYDSAFPGRRYRK